MTRRQRDRQWWAVVLTVVFVAALLLVPGVLPGRLRALVGLGDGRLLPPVSVTTAGPHDFITTRGGDPVRWDPCRPVRYEINPRSATPRWVAMVHATVARVEELTGLRFEYAGETDRRPAWEAEFVPARFGAGAPALIAWATADEVAQLDGNVAGVGGAAPIPDQYGGQYLARGGVTLDVDSFAAMEVRRDGPAQQRALILHELGHLVGLAHVEDPGELMHPGSDAVFEFGPGDRAGLAIAGQGPCR